jgi:hypothetical protein
MKRIEKNEFEGSWREMAETLAVFEILYFSSIHEFDSFHE